MVERQQRNPDGTWTLSEHTSGMVVVLEHEVPLDERATLAPQSVARSTAGPAG